MTDDDRRSSRRINYATLLSMSRVPAGSEVHTLEITEDDALLIEYTPPEDD